MAILMIGKALCPDGEEPLTLDLIYGYFVRDEEAWERLKNYVSSNARHIFEFPGVIARCSSDIEWCVREFIIKFLEEFAELSSRIEIIALASAKAEKLKNHVWCPVSRKFFEVRPDGKLGRELEEEELSSIIEREVGKVKITDKIRGRLYPVTRLLTDLTPDDLLGKIKEDLGSKCPICGTVLEKQNLEFSMIPYDENNQEFIIRCRRCGIKIWWNPRTGRKTLEIPTNYRRHWSKDWIKKIPETTNKLKRKGYQTKHK